MEQAEIVELKSTVEAMKMELAQLKESFSSLSLSAVQTKIASASSGSYTSVAKQSNLHKSAHGRTTRGRQLSNDGAIKRAESSTGSTVMPTTKPSDPAAAADLWRKTQVVGARRICGTLRDSTVNSVKNNYNLAYVNKKMGYM